MSRDSTGGEQPTRAYAPSGDRRNDRALPDNPIVTSGFIRFYAGILRPAVFEQQVLTEPAAARATG